MFSFLKKSSKKTTKKTSKSSTKSSKKSTSSSKKSSSSSSKKSSSTSSSKKSSTGGIGNAIKNAAKKATETVKKAANTVKQTLTKAVDTVKSAVKTTTQTIKSTISKSSKQAEKRNQKENKKSSKSQAEKKQGGSKKTTGAASKSDTKKASKTNTKTAAAASSGSSTTYASSRVSKRNQRENKTHTSSTSVKSRKLQKNAIAALDLHTALDIAGMIPVIGEAADLTNGLIYAAEKDYVNAGISIAAVIPAVGEAGKAAKYGSKLVKAKGNIKAVKNLKSGKWHIAERTAKAGITGKGTKPGKSVDSAVDMARNGKDAFGGTKNVKNENVVDDKIWNYSRQFDGELVNFNYGYKIHDKVSEDLYLVQFHANAEVGKGRSLKYWTTIKEANKISTIDDYMDKMGLLSSWGSRDNVTIAKVPAGTQVKYAIGTAAEQVSPVESKNGGGTQILFEQFNERWIIETRALQ